MLVSNYKSIYCTHLFCRQPSEKINMTDHTKEQIKLSLNCTRQVADEIHSAILLYAEKMEDKELKKSLLKTGSEVFRLSVRD